MNVYNSSDKYLFDIWVLLLYLLSHLMNVSVDHKDCLNDHVMSDLTDEFNI